MSAVSASTGLSITNPLVLYRSLLASQKLRPDPAQHRLALHLQDLYFRLKDYDPEIEYRQRLDQATQPFKIHQSPKNGSKQRPRSPFVSTLFNSRASSSPILSLTRTTPLHESARHISSPQGLLLHGEVGRGKSMLLDLIYRSLPSSKKRRYHFTTFMLDIFRRVERERITTLATPQSAGAIEVEHVILRLARESIATHPILFLDEFQLPDRASSKLLSGFMTAFFHLGGVLVASSNRMPEELAKAQGIEFRPTGLSSTGRFDWRGGYSRWAARSSMGDSAAKGDFGLFLDVLKARCEVWEMEGSRDWRREDLTTTVGRDESVMVEDINVQSALQNHSLQSDTKTSSDCPAYYHLTSLPQSEWDTIMQNLNPTSTWSTNQQIQVYGRRIPIPKSYSPVSASHIQNATTDGTVQHWTFAQLCSTTNPGHPADYVSLASTAHTVILSDVPVLTSLLKNEARRFITLLDALYEARCRLLIRAAAPPDKLFFPETTTKAWAGDVLPHATAGRSSDDGREDNENESDQAIQSESFSEIYQDSTSPFRPNVSSYQTSSPSPSLRSVLADEDADFGPTYGNGRGYMSENSDRGDRSDGQNQSNHIKTSSGPRGISGQSPVDFTKLNQLTGEDERFAYKRARSRLWEMCGRRWWRERDGVDPGEWWTPVLSAERMWERSGGQSQSWSQSQSKDGVVDGDIHHGPARKTGLGPETKTDAEVKLVDTSVDGSHDGSARRVDHSVTKSEDDSTVTRDDSVFRHGASPFRTRTDAPPKFGWQHAWGMMRWGRKAGEWGKGVEGDRRKDS